MAPILKIKRNTSGTAPTSLQEGELAADISNKKLYIGTSSSPVLIGDGASTTTQAANTFFAAPASSNGIPSFRAISANDLASNASSNTYLRYNGSALEWATVAGGGGGGTPAGSTGSIQVNNAGIFSAKSNFTFSNNDSTIGSNYGYNFNIGSYSANGNIIKFSGRGPESNGTTQDTFFSQINFNSNTQPTFYTDEYTVNSVYADTIAFSSVATVISNSTVSNSLLDSGSNKISYVTITLNLNTATSAQFKHFGIIPNDHVKWSAFPSSPNELSTNVPYKIAYMQNHASASQSAGGVGLILSNSSQNLISSYSSTGQFNGTTSEINCGTKRPFVYVVSNDGFTITSHTQSYAAAATAHGLNAGDAIMLYMANAIGLASGQNLLRSQTEAPRIGFTVTKVVATASNIIITLAAAISQEEFNIGDPIYIEGSSTTNLNNEYSVTVVNTATKELTLTNVSGSYPAVGTYDSPSGYFSCRLLTPKLYYVHNSVNSSQFQITDVLGQSAVKVYAYNTFNLTTSGGCFFRRLPAYSFSVDPNVPVGTHVATMTNTENFAPIKFIMGSYADERIDASATAKAKLIVSNGLDLKVGDKFYIDREIHSASSYSFQMLPGVLYEISEINYNLYPYASSTSGNIDTYIISGGTLTTDASVVGKQSYLATKNRSQNAYICTITVKNINPYASTHALYTGSGLGSNGNNVPYMGNPGSFYYNKKSTHMILVNKTPKVLNKYTAGGVTYYVMDRLLWHPDTSTAPKVRFFTSAVTNQTTLANRGKDIFNINHNTAASPILGSTGLYLTSTDQIILGRYNTSFTTANAHSQNPLVAVTSTSDTSAFIALKKPNYYNDPDNLLYSNLNNNFRLYINPGAVEPVSTAATELQFWVLGAYGQTPTDAPDPTSPSSFLRWFRITKSGGTVGTLLTGGQGSGSGLSKTDVYDELLGETFSQITLADEVPINTSLTVPLIKGTQGEDLNITVESPENNINIAIPQSNTDVALSSGSIYITSGLDAGDVYVQSAEDIYLTSQNVRISGNLIVDGYIESGTGFQGDNTDAEEPIIGLVMDGGTF